MTISPSLVHLMGLDILNTREWAILFWTISFSYYVLFIKLNDKMVTSLRALLKASFNLKILVPVMLMVVYIFCTVQCLELCGIWDSRQLKNTIFWTLSVGLVSLGRIASSSDKHPFQTLLVDHFKILAILEFIVNIQTFSFLAELIIVPVSTFLFAMFEFSKGKKDVVIVHNIMSVVLFVIGMGLILSSVISLVSSFGNISNMKTYSDFYTPPLLTVAFLPYLFVLALIINYEDVFVRLQFRIKDEKVLKFAKMHSLQKFNFRTKLLRRWWRTLHTANTETIEDVKKSVKNILRLDKKERTPKIIDKKEGWSPYAAKEFLDKYKISTGFYNPSTVGEWYAESHFIPLSDGVDANKIVYYVDGEEDVAKRLKIKLCIDVAKTALEDHGKLLEYTEELELNALNIELPEDLKECIKIGKERFVQIHNYVLQVQRGEWFNINGDGYMLAVTLTHESWADRGE